MLKRIVLGTLALAGLALATLFVWPVPMAKEGNFDGIEGDPARGAYVARLGGCFACHTDAKGGGAMLAGGPALKTPFGDFYAPNITMHETDGIGAWTLHDFDRAMRSGVSPAGAHYYPAFPYGHYAALKNQDIADLWAAFRTVPPVAGTSPDHDLTFPFDYRALLRPWKTLFFDPSPLPDDPARSAKWNRGRYLVEGLGHCSACHTPRTPLGGLQASAALRGAKGYDGETIPALTSTALGKAGYSTTDIAIALKTGITPQGDALGGSMAEVVSGATRFWTKDDLNAVADYLMPGD